MSEAIAFKDVASVMQPVISVLHLLGGRNWDGAFLWRVLFDFSGRLFLESVHSSRDKSGRECDSSNLGTEEVFLISEVEWIGDNLSVQVASEVGFDRASSSQIGRSEIF